jgi:pyruvate ferredoxin oxidoreductase alpha subunit
VTIGAMVGPEAFTEVRYLAHYRQEEALELIPDIAAEFNAAFGRDSGGLVRPYRLEDAETVVIAMGSVLGTIKDVIDEMRDSGVKIGALGIVSYRPFPAEAIRGALCNARRWVVVEKALAVGLGGVVSTDVRMALDPKLQQIGTSAIAGLGGRAITKASLRRLFDAVAEERAEPLQFLDLDLRIVKHELERMGSMRRSGPIAENLLKHLGAVAAHIA